MGPADLVENKDHDLGVLELQVTSLWPERFDLLNRRAWIRFQGWIIRDTHPLDPEGGARRLHESVGGEGWVESIGQVAEERDVGNLAIHGLGIEMDGNVERM